MHSGLALDSSDKDLWNVDMPDTHLDSLDTDILSKYFVCLQYVFKKFVSLRKTSYGIEYRPKVYNFEQSVYDIRSIDIFNGQFFARCFQGILEDEKLLR